MRKILFVTIITSLLTTIVHTKGENNGTHPMKITVETRTDLYFETSDSSMDRQSESYSLVKTESKLIKTIEQTILTTTKLIDTQYWPDELVVYLEKEATIRGPTYIEVDPDFRTTC